MLTSDFDFELPDELIPARPRRGASRLMVVDPAESRVATHRVFQELPHLLGRGDLLVLNDTKVLRARLRGRRVPQPSSNRAAREQPGGVVEALMIEPVPTGANNSETSTWIAMLRPAKRQRPGQRLKLAQLDVTVRSREGDLFALEFEATDSEVLASIEAHGELPLPPYLGRAADARDDVDYQTVYANEPGAVAAPTAGLHFDQALFTELASRGVTSTKITLHVGPGTFRPVKSDDVSDHEMDAERYTISASAAENINRTKREGGRVIAVGTTVTRTLEAAAQAQTADGTQVELSPTSGRTNLFIVPGHDFKIIDGLITNFHLPRSTLLMLVSAFVGRERTLAAYREAVNLRYNFYSYGDAMLLWPGGELSGQQGNRLAHDDPGSRHERRAGHPD